MGVGAEEEVAEDDCYVDLTGFVDLLGAIAESATTSTAPDRATYPGSGSRPCWTTNGASF